VLANNGMWLARVAVMSALILGGCGIDASTPGEPPADDTVLEEQSNGRPVYTFSLHDDIRGAHGGGALRDDGTATGQIPVSRNNGAIVGKISVTSWSTVIPDTLLLICFDYAATRGPVIFPPHCEFFPVTGTPIVIPSAAGDIHLRVTRVDG
jgi:hypothetical protein